MDGLWNEGIVDAYSHIGNPKYGTLHNLKIFYDTLKIKKGVIVLGPGIPDFNSILNAKEFYGDNIRFMGIPFGNTKEQRMELGEIQIKMGISGMRLMPFELEPNKELIERLGEEGLCLMAINPYDSKEASCFLLEWLERFPKGKVVSPHFLIPQTIEERVEDVSLFKELLRHPRFYAVLSRQGDVGSRKPYPYKDLLPWVEQLVENVTWKRLMWGSEFPILYQRNENPKMVRNWMTELNIEMTEEERHGFYRNNAERCFFRDVIEKAHPVEIPSWVEKQVNRKDTVYLFPNNRVFIPMEDYDMLLTDYITDVEQRPELMFAEYIAEKLSETARAIKSRR